MKQFIFLNEKKIKNSTRVWSVFDGHLCSSNYESSPKWLREKQAVTKKISTICVSIETQQDIT